jgi:cytochrome c oxidase subunit 4
MSPTAESARAWTIWRRNLITWALLLVLLAITCSAAYMPLGSFNVVVALAVATLKAGLVALVFMGLWRAPALIRLVAGAGFFWLIVLFVLTFSDFLTRP